MANLLASLFGTGKPKPGIPMDAATAKTTPDATYLENMQKLLKGDVSSTLTGGEKLMALGALLRSASRGSQVTPQEVMGQVRQTAQTRAATQLQLAQLQAAMDRKAKTDAAWSAYTSTLTPEKQKLAEGYTDEQRSKALVDAVNPEPFQMTERGGDTYMVFRGGSAVKIEGLPKDVERVGDANHGYKFFYKGTTEPVLDKTGKPMFIPGEISPLDAAQLAQGQQRIDISRQGLAVSQANAANARSATERGQLVPTDQGYAVWSPRAQTLRPLNSPLKPKSVDPLARFSSIFDGDGTRRLGR